jgi:CO/xanthine dehydrogenase Mo-binding subunit
MSDLSVSLKANPQLGQWLAILREGRVEVRSGKVELGQGIATALAQIVAEELDVAPGRIVMVRATTAGSPNEGFTSGSLSVQDSGSALRQVCAETRAIYLHAAAQKLEVSGSDLEIVDGEIRVRGAPGLRTSYWELAAPALLQRAASGNVAPKAPPPQGASAMPQRLDLPDKLLGRAAFLHDLELPGMLHARVAHPPSPAAQLLAVDLASVEALPGVVRVLRQGSFLAVTAASSFDANRALRKLKSAATWRESETLPDGNDLPAFLRSQPAETTVVAECGEDLAPAPGRGFAASYARPYLAHASIAPSCGVAHYDGQRLEVWTHAQGVYPLQRDLALLLGIPADAITVSHVPGAGCYGHNGADDAAVDAAVIAHAAPGRPVRVLWTREDELACAPFGAAMAVEVRATVGADGRIAQWQHETWSNGHSMRPGRMPVPVFHAAPQLGFEPQVSINVPIASGGGAERNSVPTYDFPRQRIVSHRLLTMPLRTSALRSLGAHCNVFAAESMMDEIAQELGVDPLAFRLRHLRDARGIAVLEKVAQMADWPARAPREGEGLGIGYARYKNNGAWCAAVAQVEVQQEVRVRRVWLAVDVGRVVHADGVINQVEGGAIQTVSWCLKEAVQFDRTRVTSERWSAYPVLKFSEVPAVEVALIDRPMEKSLGAGEPTHGPLAAAIGNALAQAAGVRLRELPFTMERVRRAALAA